MNINRWTIMTGVLLIACIVASAIFLQQRNESRQLWRERQAELDTARKLLQQAKGETAGLEEKLASAGKRIADFVSEGAKRKTTIAVLERQAEEQQKQIQALQDATAAKEKRLSESQDSLAVLERRAEEQQKQIQNLQNAMTAKEKRLSESQDSLWAQQAAVKESAAGLEARLKDLTAERDRLITNTEDLKAQGRDLQALVATMETQHRLALTDRDEKIAALSSALKDSAERLDKLEKDKDTLFLKLRQANRTIIGLRDQLEDVIAQVPALKNRLEQSTKKYRTASENLTEARARQVNLEAQQKAMRETYEALVTGLKKQLDSQEASIEEYREKLKVTFVDRILFGFSQVSISPQGKAALDQLAGVLANVPKGKISIAGHADSIPVAQKFQYRFPSNWELSSARAAAVARYLLKKGDLEPSRIEVVGLSRYQPVADNDTEAGRAKNRRVEIIITPGR